MREFAWLGGRVRNGNYGQDRSSGRERESRRYATCPRRAAGLHAFPQFVGRFY
jgi:hypothetical protein